MKKAPSLRALFLCLAFHMESKNFTIELCTPRLRLRKIQLEDAMEISNLLKDREVAATTLMLPFPCSTEDARSMINKYKDEEKLQKAMRWAITNIENNKMMGGMRLVLNKAFNSAEIGFWLGKAFWRNNYTWEAANKVIAYGFEELKLNRLEAHAMVENLSSIYLLEKLGFTQEGLHPELVIKWGEYKDVLTFGLLLKKYTK